MSQATEAFERENRRSQTWSEVLSTGFCNRNYVDDELVTVEQLKAAGFTEEPFSRDWVKG